MGKRKEYTGTVISNKMQKTAVVKVEQTYKHAKYSKIMRQYNKFKVHDEKSQAQVDDLVHIQECRPISKDKYFRLVKIVKKSQIPHIEIKEEAI